MPTACGILPGQSWAWVSFQYWVLSPESCHQVSFAIFLLDSFPPSLFSFFALFLLCSSPHLNFPSCALFLLCSFAPSLFSSFAVVIFFVSPCPGYFLPWISHCCCPSFWSYDSYCSSAPGQHMCKSDIWIIVWKFPGSSAFVFSSGRAEAGTLYQFASSRLHWKSRARTCHLRLTLDSQSGKAEGCCNIYVLEKEIPKLNLIIMKGWWLIMRNDNL